VLALTLRWGHSMVGWGFWDLLAYCSLYVGAIILAAETSISQSPTLRSHLPRIFTLNVWAFVPIVLLTISGVILLLRSSGIIADTTQQTVSPECMTVYGGGLIPDGKNLEVRADGLCFTGKEKTHYIASVAFHWDGTVDSNDAEIELKSAPYDIVNHEIVMKIPRQAKYLDEVAHGARMTNYALLLVPKSVELSQFMTLRQARNLNVIVVSARGGPP